MVEHHLKVYLDLLMITIFFVFSSVYVFLYFVPIIDISLIFHSSPYMSLGYNTSNLGYKYLDFSSDQIYNACHVRFHEMCFFFMFWIDTTYAFPICDRFSTSLDLFSITSASSCVYHNPISQFLFLIDDLHL